MNLSADKMDGTERAMNKRIEGVPVYEQIPSRIEAKIYNEIRLGLIRQKKTSLRFTLEGLRTLDIILENDAWIVVDRSLGDAPIMAWLEFETPGRETLHAPVLCKINYYHAHASIIRERILENTYRQVHALLHPDTQN